MLLQLSYIVFALTCLNLGHAMPEPKQRIARDTKNIPTSMFKPIGQSINVAQNDTLSPQDEYGETFQQRSTGETHAVLADEDDESTPNYPIQNFREPVFNNPSTGFRNYPINYPIDQRGSDISRSGLSPSRAIFNSFTNDNFPNDNFQNFPNGGRRFPQSSFINSGPTLSRNGNNFIRSGPINSGSMPLMSNHLGPSFSRGPGPDGGSSNNFYRSESYSYNSDGSGPPQIQQDVFDSRQGFGTSFRNF